MQEIVDLRRRDTEVSAPAYRRHRLRAVPPPVEPEPAMASTEMGETVAPFVDPGDTMAQATAIQVRLREAIVRRNHRSERSELFGCTDIEWASSRELAVKRIARGVLRIEQKSEQGARVSIGIDGLAFTVAVAAGASAAQAIKDRLSTHYRVEIVEESPSSQAIVLTGFAPHT
jgi:hypothetical protein